MSTTTGQLSNSDILNEQASSSGLHINNFHPSRLKAASYDITPSIIAMSSRTGMLETVYQESVYPFHHYIIVSAKDSVLVVSNEFIDVPNYIAGHIVSRVSKVVDGFGHISTSIDPGWRGAVLIALSNPSSKPIKVRVGTALNGTIPESSLATIIFNYLTTPSDLGERDKYPGMRLDLLQKCCYKNRQGFRAWWYRCIHPSRRRFTDFFFAYCQIHKDTLDINNWHNIIQAFSGCPESPSPNSSPTPNDTKGKEKHPCDFVIQESLWTRFLYFQKRHYQVLRAIIITIFILLVILGVLPNEISNTITNVLTGG